MRCGDRNPILLCPIHMDGGRGHNKPRSRNPLMQCCMLDSCVSNGRHHHHEQLRYSQLMLKNIKIPSSYYTSTDPKYLSADIIKNLTSMSGTGERKLVTVSRSSSNVSVRQAQHVKLRTSSLVTRSQSFSDQNNRVSRKPSSEPVRYSYGDKLSRVQQSDARQRPVIIPSINYQLAPTLSNKSLLPWEYKVAGIGMCWQGESCKHGRLLDTQILHGSKKDRNNENQSSSLYVLIIFHFMKVCSVRH